MADFLAQLQDQFNNQDKKPDVFFSPDSNPSPEAIAQLLREHKVVILPRGASTTTTGPTNPGNRIAAKAPQKTPRCSHGMFDCHCLSTDWWGKSNGRCLRCAKPISHKTAAKRAPEPHGGYSGCYCSWDCTRKTYCIVSSKAAIECFDLLVAELKLAGY